MERPGVTLIISPTTIPDTISEPTVFGEFLEGHTCKNRYDCFMDSLYFLLLKHVAREQCHYEEHDQDEERP